MMDERDCADQQVVHDALDTAMRKAGLLGEGQVLAGWVVCYEVVVMGDGPSHAGSLYGPIGMTTWRALGVIEWARRFSLGPDESDNDDD